MAASCSGIVVTGASGFIGRHLVEALEERYRIYGISRGAPSTRGMAMPARVRWFYVDIGDASELGEVFEEIHRAGGAEIVIHLAGHYDFSGERHPAYARTNVAGTRNVLEAARRIGARDVIFASSVAACQFPPAGSSLTERSPPDGDTPYADSKRAGEALAAEYRGTLRVWIVRFAALFSDWCEYEPLFRFLEAWLSRAPRSRLLAGRGLSAIPYLHIKDAIGFFHALLARREALDAAEVLLASSDGASSHLELFEAATTAQFGNRIHPIHLPRLLCGPGLRAREALGRVVGAPAFERPWMGRMIDLQLRVDAQRTRTRLGWAPRPRLGIYRRMPFLIQNRKSFPAEWQRRNHASLKQVRLHENLRIHRLLRARGGSLAEALAGFVLDRARAARFPGVQTLRPEQQRADNELLIQALVDTVRTGEKSLFRSACRELAARRRVDGFTLDELSALLDALNDLCVLTLADVDPAASWSLALYDHVTMTVQFGLDAVCDVFEVAG